MLVLPEKNLAQAAVSVLPRLGQINFVNCLPVVLPMMQSDWQTKAQVTYATPNELNQAFARNELDIGAMSSFYFLQDDTLKLVDGLSISSDGAVASVICYSKVPLSQLNGARIAVPASSASSVSLLLVLLKELFGAVPELVPSLKPSIHEPGIEAALVFGDQALLAEGVWERKLVKADLGEWWRINTGLPMVYGLWAANARWAGANQEQFDGISTSLRHSAQKGLSGMFSAVVEEGVRRTGLTHERIARYFQTDLNYAMTARHHRALEEYGKLCRKHKLLRPL